MTARTRGAQVLGEALATSVGMAGSGRSCRIAGCERRHPRTHFCCRVHWRALPREFRDAIWRAYRNPGVFSDEYQQAAENAEAFLEDRDARDMLGPDPA